MTARLLSLWSRINASYWFYPAIFSILAFFLALGMVALDRNLSEDYFVGSDWLVPARPGGASDMLQVIAGSTIGVAATVFSITIVAVSYASGTYGPRLLTNFMEDKGNQLSLATFIGTFVYAVMVLRVVRREDESPAAALNGDALPGFVPQMSLLVAIALMLTSIGVLVFFLNHVPDSIRINTVLEDIGKRLIRQIQRRFPQEGDEVEEGAAHVAGDAPLHLDHLVGARAVHQLALFAAHGAVAGADEHAGGAGHRGMKKAHGLVMRPSCYWMAADTSRLKNRLTGLVSLRACSQ